MFFFSFLVEKSFNQLELFKTDWSQYCLFIAHNGKEDNQVEVDIKIESKKVDESINNICS